MRKSTEFNVEGKEKKFEIREFTIGELLTLLDSAGSGSGEDGKQDDSIESFAELFNEKFLPLVSNITMEDLLGMTPSEIEYIWEKFQKVNKSFFRMARTMNLNSIANQMRDAIIEDFGKWLASSSSLGTTELPNTDTATS